MKRPQRQSDAGFTMLELLIVVVVLPLLIGALATLIITLMQNTVQNDPHGTATRLADSHDAQLTSVYFSRDVQSAASVSTAPTPLCAPTGAADEQILGLQWTSGGQTMDVSYFVQQTPNLELVRYYCTSSSPTTPATTSLISDNIFDSTTTASAGACPASPAFGSGANICAVNSSGNRAYLATTVTCFTRSTNAPVACPGINSNPGTAVNTASTVVATVQITAQESLSSYQYALTASPRGSTPALGIPSNAGVFPPFISNGPVSAGNCTVETDGMMSVNSMSNGSISDGPNGTITASGGIVSSDPNTSQAAASGPGTGTVSPKPVFGITQASPYDGQAEPPSAPTPPPTIPVVTKTTNSWDPSTDNKATDPTGYVVNSQGALDPTKYPNGAIFIVQNGMKVSKQFSAPQGVLFYVSGGNVDLSGNGSISLNSLSPNFESQPQPAAPEIVLWISKNDTNNPPTLTLGGNGNTTAINGAIYAPTTDVIMNGGGTNGGVSASAFDIGQLKTCNGGGNVPVNISVGFPSSVTTVSPSAQSVSLGSTVTATATVTGFNSSATPSGTATFYECGPAAAGSCTNTTGAQVGSPMNVSGAGTTVTATSSVFTPLLPGSYCFAAYYSGDGTYPASADTSSDGCFTVTAVDTPVILSPTDGACYNSTGHCSTRWPGINGTATDTGGPGLQNVQITIVDSSGKYWDGTSFSPTTPDWLDTTFTATGPPIWSWSYSGAIAFEAGTNSYTITARSMDTTGGLSLTTSVTVTVKG